MFKVILNIAQNCELLALRVFIKCGIYFFACKIESCGDLHKYGLSSCCFCFTTLKLRDAQPRVTQCRTPVLREILKRVLPGTNELLPCVSVFKWLLKTNKFKKKSYLDALFCCFRYCFAV